jgi:hypothetical protein
VRCMEVFSIHRPIPSSMPAKICLPCIPLQRGFFFGTSRASLSFYWRPTVGERNRRNPAVRRKGHPARLPGGLFDSA